MGPIGCPEISVKFTTTRYVITQRSVVVIIMLRTSSKQVPAGEFDCKSRFCG